MSPEQVYKLLEEMVEHVPTDQFHGAAVGTHPDQNDYVVMVFVKRDDVPESSAEQIVDNAIKKMMQGD